MSPASTAGELAEWRCFHCDEVFTDRRCAVDHFGAHEGCEPACQIKMGAERSLLTALRRAEGDANEMMQRLQSETTDSAKAYYAQNARHQEQLRAAEELGFERGTAESASALTAQEAKIRRLEAENKELKEKIALQEIALDDLGTALNEERQQRSKDRHERH